jgi:hypothetical protein
LTDGASAFGNAGSSTSAAGTTITCPSGKILVGTACVGL